MKIIFDIGGTNMRFSSVVDGNLSNALKVTTPADLTSGKKVIIELIRKIAREEEVVSIVGGVPGVARDGVIITAPNLEGWNGFDIKSFLQENFCQKVLIRNDADLAGLGESLYGAGRGASVVAYIGVGTGVGGARIVNGTIDANKYGFEPGHHIIDMTNDKTFEDIVGGRAILEKYKIPAEQVGQEEIKKLTPSLVVGLCNTIRFWSPDVLVLGGSLMNEETAYKIEDARKGVEEINTDIRKLVKGKLLEIRKAELGDHSGLYGALALSMQ